MSRYGKSIDEDAIPVLHRRNLTRENDALKVFREKHTQGIRVDEQF